MKNFLLLFLFISIIDAGEFEPFQLTIGGGYPFGIIGKLNDDFKTAFDQVNSTWSSGNSGSLVKAKGWSINTNLAFVKIDTTKNVNFGCILGYAYHSTGEAKYELKDNLIPLELSVTGKYNINELRIVPSLIKFTEENIFGGGVGLTYNIVKYNQKHVNSSGTFVLPNMESGTSGATLCIYGFLRIGGINDGQSLVLEIELNGLNTLYIGGAFAIL
jgi:hypothetical protein